MEEISETLQFTKEEAKYLRQFMGDAQLKLETSQKKLVEHSRFVFSNESFIQLEEDLKISNNFIKIVSKIKGNPNYLFEIRDVKTVLLALLFCPMETEIACQNENHYSLLKKIETRLKTLNSERKSRRSVYA